MSACKYGDPLCPCQDGLACHYEEVGGVPAMNVPAANVREIIAERDELSMLVTLLKVTLEDIAAGARIKPDYYTLEHAGNVAQFTLGRFRLLTKKAQAIETGTADTAAGGIGAKHESAVRGADAPITNSPSHNTSDNDR